MKFSIALICLVAVFAVATAMKVESPAATKTELIWENLFPPPYTAAPRIMFDLACISPDLCFIPGAAGNDFGMFKFNGQPNGAFEPMPFAKQRTAMILTTAMGGTAQSPVGTFGGVGGAILDFTAPIQYINATNMTWQPSIVEDLDFILHTQSMRSTDDGKHIMFVGSGITGDTVMHSEDGGVLFEAINTDKTIPRPKNCTHPLYAAMIDEKTWYLTVGQSPEDRKDPNNNNDFEGNRILAKKNRFINIVEDKKTKQVRYSMQPLFDKFEEDRQRDLGDYICVGYEAMIAKTTDAGKTWTIQFQASNPNFAFAQIDCISDTHCVAVGTGETLGSKTVIYQTTDGQTWKEVFSVLPSGTEVESLYTIRFKDAQHVWAAGGVHRKDAAPSGLLYFSNDGGNTWEKYPYLQPDLYSIMDLSFAGGIGYATAMSEFKTGTVLKYANQPFYGYFTQAHCPIAGCKYLCQNVSFPQGMCLGAEGGSAMAFCTPEGVKQQIYETTSCIGAFKTYVQPLNTCLNGTNTFFENFCPSGNQAVDPSTVASVGRQHKFLH